MLFNILRTLTSVADYVSVYLTSTSLTFKSATNAEITVNMTTPITMGVWSHVAFNFRGSDGYFEFYVNGNRVVATNSTSLAFYALGLPHAYNVVFGSAPSATFNIPSERQNVSFSGQMDNMFLHSSLLTQSEITAMAANNFLCDGKLPTDPTVCGSYGTCVAQDVCSCYGPASKWTGVQCDNTCSGKQVLAEATVVLDYYASLSFNSTEVVEGNTLSFTMDTASLISAKKMRSDCSDLRIFFNNATDVGRGVSNCNSANTVVSFNYAVGVTRSATDSFSIQYGGPMSFWNSFTVPTFTPSTAVSTTITQGAQSEQLHNCFACVGNFGQMCEITACSGIASSSPSVCSGHGQCVATDTCACNDPCYIGTNCGINVCTPNMTIELPETFGPGAAFVDQFTSGISLTRTIADTLATEMVTCELYNTETGGIYSMDLFYASTGTTVNCSPSPNPSTGRFAVSLRYVDKLLRINTTITPPGPKWFFFPPVTTLVHPSVVFYNTSNPFYTLNFTTPTSFGFPPEAQDRIYCGFLGSPGDFVAFVYATRGINSYSCVVDLRTINGSLNTNLVYYRNNTLPITSAAARLAVTTTAVVQVYGIATINTIEPKLLTASATKDILIETNNFISNVDNPSTVWYQCSFTRGATVVQVNATLNTTTSTKLVFVCKNFGASEGLGAMTLLVNGVSIQASYPYQIVQQSTFTAADRLAVKYSGAPAVDVFTLSSSTVLPVSVNYDCSVTISGVTTTSSAARNGNTYGCTVPATLASQATVALQYTSPYGSQYNMVLGSNFILSILQDGDFVIPSGQQAFKIDSPVTIAFSLPTDVGLQFYSRVYAKIGTTEYALSYSGGNYRLTSAVIAQPGVYSVSLLIDLSIANNHTVQYGALTFGAVKPIVFVKTQPVVSLTPQSWVVGPSGNQGQLILKVAPGPDLYQGYANYSCVASAVASVVYSATFDAASGTYNCSAFRNVIFGNMERSFQMWVVLTANGTPVNVTTISPFYSIKQKMVSKAEPIASSYTPTDITTGKTISVTLTTADPLIGSSVIFCALTNENNSSVSYAPIVTTSSSQLSCNLNKTDFMSISSNPKQFEIAAVYLVVQLSSTTYQTLSLNIVNIPLYYTGITLGGTIVTLSNIGDTRALSTPLYRDSAVNYTLRYAPYNGYKTSATPVVPYKQLSCTLDTTSTSTFPMCTFQDSTVLNVAYLPQPIQLQLVASRVSSPDSIVTVAPFFVKGNVTFNYLFPYIGNTADYVNKSMPVKSTFSDVTGILLGSYVKDGLQLNPNFNFTCTRTGLLTEVVPAVVSGPREATCNIKSAGVDESVQLTLSITSDPPTEYGYTTTLPGQAGIVSTNVGKFDFATLYMNPPYLEYATNSRQLIVNATNPDDVFFPSFVHQLYATYVVIDDIIPFLNSYRIGAVYRGEIDFYWLVQVNRIVDENNLPYYLPAVQTDPEGTVRGDIQKVTAKLYQQSMDFSPKQKYLTTLARPILVFKQGVVTLVQPRAALRFADSSVTLQFDRSLFNLANLTASDVVLSCASNHTSWNGSITTLTSMTCSFKYNATELINNNLLKFVPQMTVPSIDYDLITLTLPKTQPVFYYLDQGSIAFNNPAESQLYFLEDSFTIPIAFSQINIPMVLINASLIQCRIVTSDGVRSVYHTVYGGQNATHSIFYCQMQGDSSYLGLRNLSLWFVDGGANGEFELSTNELPMVFTTRAAIYGLVPLATLVNKDQTTNLTTSLVTTGVNYPVTFACELTYSAGGSQSQPASIIGNGIFQCLIPQRSVDNTVYIKISIQYGSTKVILTQNQVWFYIVTNMFLTPSYGRRSDINTTIVDPFNPISVARVLLHDLTYSFPCSPIGSILSCTTVQMPLYSDFQAYDLTFDDTLTTPLSFPWITYERRQLLTLRPRLISTNNTSPQISVTVDSSIAVASASPSEVQVIVGYFSPYFQRLSMGQNMAATATASLTTMPAGDYTAAVYYYHPRLLELYNSLALSSSLPITFVKPNPISIVDTNIGYIATKFNMTVSLFGPLLPSAVVNDIYCIGKAGFSVHARYNGNNTANQWTCEMYSTVAGVDNVGLQYKTQDGIDVVLLTNTTIPVVYIEKVQILSRYPIATLLTYTFNTSYVSITTSRPTLPTLPQDFNGQVDYLCYYYDSEEYPRAYYKAPAFASATRNETTYTCRIDRGTVLVLQKEVKITIYARSRATPSYQIPMVVGEPAKFFFMQTLASSMTPFAVKYNASEPALPQSNVTVTITTSDDILTSEDLHCRFFSEIKTDYVFSKAFFVDTTVNRTRTVTCNVWRSYFVETVANQFTTVQLTIGSSLINATTYDPNVLDITLPTTKIVYLRTPIAFEPIDTSYLNVGIDGSLKGFIHWDTFVLNPQQLLIKSVALPFVDLPNLIYAVTMKAENASVDPVPLVCTGLTLETTVNNQIWCDLTKPQGVVVMPSMLEFNLYIYDTASMASTNVSITSLVYFETTSINKVYPFMMAYYDTARLKVPIYASFARPFNTEKFTAGCILNETVSPFRNMILPGVNAENNLFYCNFAGFANPFSPQSVKVSAYFSPKSDINTFYAKQDNMLSEKSKLLLSGTDYPLIRFVTPKTASLSVTKIPISISIPLTIQLVEPPTSYADYSNAYNITLRVRDPRYVQQNIDGGNSAIFPCGTATLVAGVWQVNCMSPIISSSLFPTLPYPATVELLMNGVRAMPLAPKVTFFNTEFGITVLPSMFIPTGSTVSKNVFIGPTNWLPAAITRVNVNYGCIDCQSLKSATTFELQSCDVVNNTLQCPAPQYNFVIPSRNKTLSAMLSFEGAGFTSVNLTAELYDPSYITFTDLSTNQACTPEKPVTVTIKGSNFFQSLPGQPNNILVRVFDDAQRILKTNYATFINENAIQVILPQLWDVNTIYPRTLEFAVSFDNGRLFLPVPKTKNVVCTQAPTVTVSDPVMIPQNTKVSGLVLNNFPTTGLPITGRPTDQLYWITANLENGNYTISLDCDGGSTVDSLVCSSDFIVPDSSIPYNFAPFVNYKVGDVTYTVRAYFPIEKQITTFTPPTFTLVSAQYLYPGSKLPITFTLGTPLPSYILPYIRARIQTTARRISNLEAFNETQVVVGENLDVLSSTSTSQIQIANPKTDAIKFSSVALQVLISYNNGFAYDAIPQPFGVVPAYRITSIENVEDSNLATTYTFKPTPLIVRGTGFSAAAAHNFKIKLTSNLGDATPNVGPVTWNGDSFSFTMPNITNAMPSEPLSELRFPYTTMFSVTLNGFDYFDFPSFYWMDTYRPPLLAYIAPLYIPRFVNVTLAMQGQYLTDTRFCLFRAVGMPDMNTTATLLNNTIYCAGPLVTNTSITQINVKLRNSNQESTTTVVMTIFDTPVIENLTPTSGQTAGNFQFNITVRTYAPTLQLYTRFNDLENFDACKLNTTTLNANSTDVSNPINETAVYTCNMSPHESGYKKLFISYNKEHWYAYGGVLYNFTNGYPITQNEIDQNRGVFYFIPCAAGYEATDYTKICTMCEPGSYKPTTGIFQCPKCDNNTFSDVSAALTCNLCPSFTTTNGVGANGTRSCVCNIGYYNDPKFLADYNNPSSPYYDRNSTVYNKRCLPCPTGGACLQTNTSYPQAQYGFWFEESDPFTFFRCFPAKSCPGGGPRNCTFGYQGTNCGLCLSDLTNPDQQFYKWRNSCEKCAPGAWWRALLVVIFVVVLTLAFFAFSSIKVSHISSISIGFSFWQIVSLFQKFDVNWPGVVSDSITAASVSNFNFDFISPECVFPGGVLTWQIRWVIYTAVPFAFSLAFLLLYILGEIRSFIAHRIGRCVPIPYMAFYQPPKRLMDLYGIKKKNIKQLIIFYASELWLIIKNMLVWFRNFIVWFFRQGLTRHQMQTFRNKCLNSYSTFLSFTYIFIMTQASSLFLCTTQPNGSFTLDASPNIFCYDARADRGGWYYMLPVTIVIYIVFGLGAIVFFFFLWLVRNRLTAKENKLTKQRIGLDGQIDTYKRDRNIVGDVDVQDIEDTQIVESFGKLAREQAKLENSEKNFRERYKFLLTRFRKKYFFWEVVITARKLALSLLYAFLKPVQVVVFGICVMFVALLLHFNCVPYRLKGHNLMEYVTLLATLLTLFFGLLFFVDKFPTEQWKNACIVITMIVIISCTVIIVLMILFDMWTRRQKDNKKKKLLKEELEKEIGKDRAIQLNREYKTLFPRALNNMNKIIIDEDDDEGSWIVYENELVEDENIMINEEEDDDEWVVVANLLAEDATGNSVYETMDTRVVRVEFDLPFYLSDEEEDDENDGARNINDIVESMFDMKRAKRRIKAIVEGFMGMVNKVRNVRRKTSSETVVYAY
jgi:hypothetical protein